MVWETKISINQVFELRCKTTNFFGVGAINKFHDIAKELKDMGIDKVLICTGKTSYKATGAWDVVKPALEENGIEYALCDKVTPNPTVEIVDEAKEMGLELGAGAVIGIGGGSPIDTAKGAAVLLEYKDKTARDLYELKFEPKKAKPIIAINTTHGTGTEVNRFAVATILEKNYKPAIAYECLYPLYTIDDPALTKFLALKQSAWTALDALNHVNESTTTKIASPFSILTGIEAVRLIARYLPAVIMNPENLQARYYLLYASAIAGISFDNGLLHITHALDHPVCAIKPELAHGHVLAILLPAVVKYVYPAVSEILAELYKPIVPELKGVPGEAEYAAKRIEQWIFNLGVKEKLGDVGFGKDDVPTLVKLAKETPMLDKLLSMSPIEATDEVIEKIHLDSLQPISE